MSVESESKESTRYLTYWKNENGRRCNQSRDPDSHGWVSDGNGWMRKGFRRFDSLWMKIVFELFSWWSCVEAEKWNEIDGGWRSTVEWRREVKKFWWRTVCFSFLWCLVVVMKNQNKRKFLFSSYLLLFFSFQMTTEEFFILSFGKESEEVFMKNKKQQYILQDLFRVPLSNALSPPYWRETFFPLAKI